MAVSASFTATGTSDVFATISISSALYWADFDTPGAGTVQLEVMVSEDGVWAPADEAVSATMAAAEVAQSASHGVRHYRWNCTAFTSGTILCYII